MGRLNLSVIIPCYNERDNIPLIVERINHSFLGRDNVEIILVDNGSTDQSDAVFAEQLAGQSRIRSVRINHNKGYGYGILVGLDAARNADVYAWTHADMQTDPRDVLAAFDLFCSHETGAVVVKGKRSNRPIIDTAFTYLMQIIASLALGTSVDDVNAQPKVFSKHFYETFIRMQAPWDFSLDLFLLYQARHAGLEILEVPVLFANRIHGESKGGGSWRTRTKLIFRTLAYILELRRKLNHSD